MRYSIKGSDDQWYSLGFENKDVIAYFDKLHEGETIDAKYTEREWKSADGTRSGVSYELVIPNPFEELNEKLDRILNGMKILYELSGGKATKKSEKASADDELDIDDIPLD